jgi:hypothetical protein
VTGADDYKVQLNLDCAGGKFYSVTGRITAVISPEELRASLYRAADEIVRQMQESAT